MMHFLQATSNAVEIIQAPSSTADNWIKGIQAVLTLAAVLVALFKDEFWSWWKTPKLVVSSDPKNPAPNIHWIDRKSDPFNFLRVVIKNNGRGPANDVKALLHVRKAWPNPIYLRWSGTIGDDQHSTHIAAGEEATLDIVIAYKEWTHTRKDLKDKWTHALVATQDRVKEQYSDGRPYQLVDLERKPGPVDPFVFELLLYSDKKALGRCHITYVHDDGDKDPSLVVGPMR